MANNPVIRKIKIADVVYDLKDGSVEEQINAAISNLGENLDIDHPVYVAEESVDTSAEVINADTLGGHPADDFATKVYVDDKISEVQVGGDGLTTEDVQDMIDTSLEGFEGGASSWNDLTDKPFYDNGQEVEVSVWNLDSAIFDRKENPDNPDEVIYFYYAPFEPEAEIEYTVTINGQTFVATAQEFYGMTVLGNLSLIEPSLSNSGEPFLIFDGNIATTIPGETHSVNVSRTISAIEKEIKPEANVTFTYVENMGPLPMNTEDFDFSSIRAGDMLKVLVDGTEYVSTVQQFEGMPVFGNLSAMMPDAPYTNEPYFGGYVAGMSMLYYTNFPVTFSIDKKIDESNYQSVISNKNLELNYDSHDRMYWNIFNSDGELELEAEYKITFNGYEYAATASSYNNGIVLFCDANDEFEIFYDPEIKEWRLFLYYIAEMPESFNSTIHIIGYVSGVKKLDKKYVPDYPVASSSKEGVIKVCGE